MRGEEELMIFSRTLKIFGMMGNFDGIFCLKSAKSSRGEKNSRPNPWNNAKEIFVHAYYWPMSKIPRMTFKNSNVWSWFLTVDQWHISFCNQLTYAFFRFGPFFLPFESSKWTVNKFHHDRYGIKSSPYNNFKRAETFADRKVIQERCHLRIHLMIIVIPSSISLIGLKLARFGIGTTIGRHFWCSRTRCGANIAHFATIHLFQSQQQQEQE